MAWNMTRALGHPPKDCLCHRDRSRQYSRDDDQRLLRRQSGRGVWSGPKPIPKPCCCRQSTMPTPGCSARSAAMLCFTRAGSNRWDENASMKPSRGFALARVASTSGQMSAFSECLPVRRFRRARLQEVGWGIGRIHNGFVLERAERAVLAPLWRPFPVNLKSPGVPLLSHPRRVATNRTQQVPGTLRRRNPLRSMDKISQDARRSSPCD